jgi:putative hydrolase of the HAD superfamily
LPSPVSPEIHAIAFDAVGTLIHPHPSAAEAYRRTGQRFGSKLSLETITARFSSAFKRQEEIDRSAGFCTDEAREVARWRAIVAQVLDDVADSEACFSELYAHFAQPTAWRLSDHAESTLAHLARGGYRIGIASNFDDRIRKVLSPTPWRDLPLIVSAAVGWRKPAGPFFEAVCATFQVQPHSVLHVGDDVANDYEGALAAGLNAVLFDPHDRASESVKRVRSLLELIES